MENLAPRIRQRNQHSTPVRRVSASLDVAPALEAVQAAGDSGRRQHQALEQLRWRQLPIGAGEEKSGEDADLSPVELELPKGFLLAPSKVLSDSRQASGHLVGLDLFPGVTAGQAVEERIGPILMRHRSKYME